MAAPLLPPRNFIPLRLSSPQAAEIITIDLVDLLPEDITEIYGMTSYSSTVPEGISFILACVGISFSPSVPFRKRAITLTLTAAYPPITFVVYLLVDHGAWYQLIAGNPLPPFISPRAGIFTLDVSPLNGNAPLG